MIYYGPDLQYGNSRTTQDRVLTNGIRAINTVTISSDGGGRDGGMRLNGGDFGITDKAGQLKRYYVKANVPYYQATFHANQPGVTQ